MADNNLLDRANATVSELADYFGVSIRTVRRWLTATDIPHRRVGSVIRFNLDEVDTWASRGGGSNGAEEEAP